MMAETLNEQDFPSLQNEFIICKKKLESKKEALKILVKQLEQAQIERDVYKNKVSQLQTENDGLKDVVGSFIHKSDKSDHLFLDESNDKKIKILTNLLQFSRDENQVLQTDIANIKTLYSETQKDNQLLRMSLSKYENQRRADINNKLGKEQLVIRLEELDAKIELLQEEVKNLHDQNKELEEERNTFYDKNTRLNTELNYILHNDDKRIVDIDAIVLENQYLKEVIKQYKEEKTLALGTAARYKEALKQRHSKSTTNSSKQNVASYLDPISPKKSSEGFFSKASNVTVVDLQRVNKALTERLTEKDTALKHQRNTNRVLGVRVSELEKKLKTLEISGLWSHEQRMPRFSEDGVCSPPISPETPILIAEQLSPPSELNNCFNYVQEDTVTTSKEQPSTNTEKDKNDNVIHMNNKIHRSVSVDSNSSVNNDSKDKYYKESQISDVGESVENHSTVANNKGKEQCEEHDPADIYCRDKDVSVQLNIVTGDDKENEKDNKEAYAIDTDNNSVTMKNEISSTELNGVTDTISDVDDRNIKVNESIDTDTLDTLSVDENEASVNCTLDENSCEQSLPTDECKIINNEYPVEHVSNEDLSLSSTNNNESIACEKSMGENH